MKRFRVERHARKGKTATWVHVGDYDALEQAYTEMVRAYRIDPVHTRIIDGETNEQAADRR